MDAVVTLKVKPAEFDLIRSSLKESLVTANQVVRRGHSEGHSSEEIREARTRSTLLTDLLKNLE